MSPRTVIWESRNSDFNSGSFFSIEGTSTITTNTGTFGGIQVTSSAGGKVNASLVFKLLKKKFGLLGQLKYTGQINKLKKLAQKYLDLGHDALGMKFMKIVLQEMTIAELRGAGIKLWIEADFISKYKNKVKGGHISNTPFEKFTRVIPDNILKKKKELDRMKIFDRYEIYHYWNEEAEKKIEKKEKITPAEKAAMRDPILFGIRKEFPGKLFFVADWVDDYCDLTFSDLVDALKINDEDVEIPTDIKSLTIKKDD